MTEEKYAAMQKYVTELAQGPDQLLSLGSIRMWFKTNLLKEGCEHKDSLLSMADSAIDLALSFNVPQIPDFIEAPLDAQIGKFVKESLRVFAERVCNADENIG
jgi:hypothetical protein